MGNCMIVRKNSGEQIYSRPLHFGAIISTFTTNSFKSGNATTLRLGNSHVTWQNDNYYHLKFSQKIKAVGVRYQSYNNSSTNGWCSKVMLQYSDDGNTWTTTGTKEFTSDDYKSHNVIFGDKGEHLYWRAWLYANGSSNWEGVYFDIIVKDFD